jgi:hypothetical protein
MSAETKNASVRVRLESLLATLHTANTIPRNRHGWIARDQLAVMLGVASTRLTQHLDLLKAYEEKIGILHPIDVMSEKVKDQALGLISEGTLRLRDGKVDRTQIGNAVGFYLAATYIARFPQLQATFEWLDGYVAEIGYQPKDIADAVQRLTAYLATNRVLRKNGLSFDCVKIGEAIGFPPHRLRRPPFSALISEGEERYAAELIAEGLTSFFNGRIFQFASLVEEGWDRDCVARIAEVFTAAFAAKAKGTTEGGYLSAKQFLLWLATSTSPSAREVFRRLNVRAGLRIPQTDWVEMLLDFQSFMNDLDVGRNTIKARLSNTQTFIQALGKELLTPPMPMSFKPRGKQKEGRYATLAEARPHSHPIERSRVEHMDDYLLFATEMLAQAGAIKGVEVDAEDQSAFVASLRRELEQSTHPPEDNPAQVVRRLLRRRLDLIEDAARRLYNEFRSVFEEGQKLLQLGQNCSDDWSVLVSRTSGKVAHRDLLRKWFPLTDLPQSKANLLRTISTIHGGLVPADSSTSPGESTFIKKRAAEHDGLVELQACLWPHPSAFGAALTLYLCETGANVTVGRKMPFGYLEQSEEPGYLRVKSYKDKARGRAIISEIEDSCAAAESILWLDSIRSREMIEIPDDQKEYLFITRGKISFKLMESEWYLYFFKALVASIPEIAHLRMTPNMLRPTVLLLAALESDGRVRASVTLGQHSEHVNQRYTGRYPLMFMYDSEVTLFNRFYEALALQAVESAHIILGVTEEDFSKRVDGIIRTGLGTLCGDPNGRPGSGGARCTKIDCWNDCPQLIVIANSEDIALLQIWQRTLRSVEGDWLRDQPERWEAVWLPWLCFADAVEAKMKISHRKVWRDATQLADRITASPHFVSHQPW